ncbi:MAG: hypothetical protein IJG87_06450 [Ruminococcus sp.]|nr:hypothetical protein [Ruminococcus sp.]
MSTISVPGSDETLDFTEAFGGVHYERRTITLIFLSLQPWSDQLEQDSSVKNALHGQKMNIVFSDDDDYYYVGRITVGDWEYYKGAGRVTITIDADPYKYKATETTKTQSGNGTVTLTNSRMAVVPYVSASAAATLAWSGNSVSISVGNNQLIPQLVLEQGDTEITVTTSGTVMFKYREGSL